MYNHRVYTGTLIMAYTLNKYDDIHLLFSTGPAGEGSASPKTSSAGAAPPPDTITSAESVAIRVGEDYQGRVVGVVWRKGILSCDIVQRVSLLYSLLISRRSCR